MKFGTTLPAVQQMPDVPDWERTGDPAIIAAVARKADELGYAWLPCSDHVVVPKVALAVMGAPWYEPATTLAFVAGMTRNIALLSHVLILPYHNPLSLAKQFATLDRLSGGRVILGVGVGHLKPEFRALRVPYAERGAITDEYIRIIKALWSNEEASFDGRYFDFREQHVAPRPVQQPHPPVWVGGNSRRAARRAAELGQGWVPFFVSPEEVRDRLDYLRRQPQLVARLPSLEVVAPAGPLEITPQAVEGERPAFRGSREQIIEDIERYRAAGATGMTVSFRANSLPEQLERMEQFVEEIAPAFR